jgi:hypothetical protein
MGAGTTGGGTKVTIGAISGGRAVFWDIIQGR